ncbi:MAG: T9SS type A sorting domain-containing protein [Candidatus Kapaibacterium sp.]
MIKTSLRVICLSLAFVSASSAQTVKPVSDTLFTIRVESIPPAPDSGGRWFRVNAVLTSASAYSVHIPGFATHFYGQSCSSQIAEKIADSAYLLADSVFIYEDTSTHGTNGGAYVAAHATPWKYKDSILHAQTIDGYKYYGSADLEFTLPPHGTLRIPYLVQAVGDQFVDSLDIGGGMFDHNYGHIYPTTPDDWLRNSFYGWFSDSTGPKGIIRRVYDTRGDTNIYWVPYPPKVSLKVAALYAGPYILFDTTTLSNKNSPAVLGGTGSRWGRISPPRDSFFESTRVRFKVVGEYSNRFTPPLDSLFGNCDSYYPYNQETEFFLSFSGAPKTVVRDTLISTSTDPWGSVVTRTPILAYTTIKGLYSLRQLGENITPFLGTSYDTAMLSNLSDYPIELKNLRLADGDNEAFQVVSAPTVIAAHDSGYIVLLLTDNNNAKDTALEVRRTWITGTVVPYQQDMSFSDSVFTCEVLGHIDVWCPVNAIYRKTPPPGIKHGVHPTGIIFPSDVTSIFTGPKSFVVYFGNFDSVSEYFYLPYFDDSHFQIAIGDFIGTGTYPLPGFIPPSPSSPSSQIQAKITFTGDDSHNYLTKLHWPRSNDTVTIDVMVIGVDAPPFSGVAVQSSSSGFSIWPNPASSILHIGSAAPGGTIAIYDLLGRELVWTELQPNTTFDISQFSPGIYSVVVNSKTGPTAIQKLTIVR